MKRQSVRKAAERENPERRNAGLNAAKKRRGQRSVWAAAGLAGVALLAWGTLLRQGTVASAATGEAAMEHVEHLVSLGPRPSGSTAHETMQRYIVEKAEGAGWTVEQDRFSATTPEGQVPMNNIVARRPGSSDRIIILAAHYDTKLFREFRFLGANDGASGAGLLLALAPVLAAKSYKHTIWLTWLDGEEAVREWTDSDSLYGSRHMAAKLQAEGSVPKIAAFVLVDMVGDRDLDIRREANSTPWLTDLVWEAARRLDHQRYFLNDVQTLSDDHLPFLAAGIPSVDLIDFNYGRGGRYWHTAEDTLDKVSAQSLQVVGEVVLEAVAELDRR
jgi:glutaminyl-peptide cyclotransferase